jgi:uncharacterized membrane protein YtjA (UPF0391 family)
MFSALFVINSDLWNTRVIITIAPADVFGAGGSVQNTAAVRRVLWMVGIVFTLVTMIACSSSAFKSIFRLARSPVPRAASSAHPAFRTFSIKGVKAADNKEFVITPRNVDYGAWYYLLFLLLPPLPHTTTFIQV